MNIGKKIVALKEGSGFKNYQEFGAAVGINGDWINELSKKDIIQTVDITRLIKICDYFNVTLEWLLSDKNNCTFSLMEGVAFDDICNMLNQIEVRLKGRNNAFNGCPMNEHSVELAKESVGIIKALIKQNL